MAGIEVCVRERGPRRDVTPLTVSVLRMSYHTTRRRTLVNPSGNVVHDLPGEPCEKSLRSGRLPAAPDPPGERKGSGLAPVDVSQASE